MTENEREIRHLLAVAHAALVPHTIDNLYWFVQVKRALAREDAAGRDYNPRHNPLTPERDGHGL